MNIRAIAILRGGGRVPGVIVDLEFIADDGAPIDAAIVGLDTHEFQRRGGSAKSEAKTRAARANARRRWDKQKEQDNE